MHFNFFICVCFFMQAACMAFINVIVHSAENLNFRVHLQHEFTMLGLDEHLEVLWCIVIVS